MTNSFEQHISSYISSLRKCEISEAISYAMDGGKRFRPRICFAILNGMNIDEKIGYDAALALEMIQTYSLIHDDLPAMDNDDMRRGKPSLHKAFREDIAILSGDQLLTQSFGVIADSNLYDDITKTKMISAISKYAGLSGMIYGQLLDVTSNGKTIDKNKLFEIQDNKTAGLFKIACLLPCFIQKNPNEEYFIKLGSLIGEIFQNQDDLFDQIKTEEMLGKSTSDIDNNKAGALTIYTINELESIIEKEFDFLDQYLNKADFDTENLKKLLLNLKKR